jgi:hypothetical protein
MWLIFLFLSACCARWIEWDLHSNLQSVFHSLEDGDTLHIRPGVHVVSGGLVLESVRQVTIFLEATIKSDYVHLL